MELLTQNLLSGLPSTIQLGSGLRYQRFPHCAPLYSTQQPQEAEVDNCVQLVESPRKTKKRKASVLAKKEPENRGKEGGAWSIDMHLHLISRAERCLSLFGRVSLTVVHPGVLDDSNLQWYLRHMDDNETSPMLCPLAFNITVAICLGASAAGEKDLEEEYWMRARRQAGELFDMCDYHVATGLSWMSEYAYRKQLIEQRTYYGTLALITCERLSACNSVLYSWLVVHQFLGGSSLTTFQEKTARAQELPYITRLNIDLTPSSSSSSPHESQTKIRKTVIEEKEREKEREIEEEGQYNKDARRYAHELALDAVFTEIVRNMTYLHSRALITTSEPSASSSFSSSSFIDRLIALQDEMEFMFSRWQQVRHFFRVAPQLKMDTIFAVNQALIYRALNREDRAVAAALDFLTIAEQPLFAYVPMLQRPILASLQVLEEASSVDRREELRRLVRALRRCNNGTFLNVPLLERFLVYDTIDK